MIKPNISPWIQQSCSSVSQFVTDPRTAFFHLFLERCFVFTKGNKTTSKIADSSMWENHRLADLIVCNSIEKIQASFLKTFSGLL